MLRFLFSAIATLLVLPILFGLLRRVTGAADPGGPRGSRPGRRRGPSTAGAPRAGDAPAIDRSAVIDVPFTEVGGEAPAEKAAARAADAARPSTGP